MVKTNIGFGFSASKLLLLTVWDDGTVKEMYLQRTLWQIYLLFFTIYYLLLFTTSVKQCKTPTGFDFQN